MLNLPSAKVGIPAKLPVTLLSTISKGVPKKVSIEKKSENPSTIKFKDPEAIIF